MILSNKMNRSLSMPVKSRNEYELNVLKSYRQTYTLYEDNKNQNNQQENEYSDEIFPSIYEKNGNDQEESESSDGQSISYYKKNNKQHKGHSYSDSTIEHSNNYSEFDQFEISYYKNKNFIRNDYNLSKRLISKNGYQNVRFNDTPKYSVRYFKDIITSLIEQHWGYTISWFIVSYLIIWFGFALLWYFIAKIHGDLNSDELTGKSLNDTFKPCVVGVKTMTGMFMHSFEISSTIGFGERYPTEECPEGVFLFVIQIIISIGIDGAMVAVVYAKTAKPIKLINKFTFSKTACIHLRDGKLCLVFRVCDPREQKSIETKIRVYFVMDIKTSEGETVKINKQLKLDGNGKSLITWPEIICHVIDEESPFYKYTGQDFNTKEYEILVTLVGLSPITGFQTESRTSYLPQEITWGQRFTNIIFYDPIKYNYIIDYDNFHKTYAVDTSSESAHHRDRKFKK